MVNARDGSATPGLEQAVEDDPAPEPVFARIQSPVSATPLESLFFGLKLLPEDIASSDWGEWSKAIEELPPRERLILEGRHGLTSKPRLTLQALGVGLGITREWVRQLQERAHRRLRRRAVAGRLIHENAPNRLRLF